MSRQSKQRNKARFHVRRAEGSGGAAKTRALNNPGPARTTPKHGKVARLPYDGRKPRRRG